MAQNLTNQEVQEIIETKFPKKFNFDEMKYINADSYLKLVCKDCGDSFSIRLRSLLHRKVGCNCCVGGTNSSWDLEEMNRWCATYAKETKILECFYGEGSKPQLKAVIRCDNPNHKPHTMRWSAFKKGRRCIECSKRISGNTKKVSKLLKDNDLELISLKTSLKSSPYMECKNKEGYYVFPTIAGLVREYTPHILNRNPKAVENIKKWCSLNRRDYRLLSLEYSGHQEDILEWEYIGELLPESESRSFYASLYNFKNNYQEHPYFKIANSRAESFIAKFLLENNISFVSQKSFENCKNKNPLPFDFAIYDESTEIILMLEADGGHHYFPVSYGGCSGEKALENFEKTQYHDQIKNDYCKKNNIPLLRIPYWEFENIEEILQDELKDKKILI